MFPLNYSTVIDPLLKGIRLYAIKFSGMKAGDRVLDVCCGTGDQVFYYAGAGFTAAGIDRDPRMLELARRDKRRSTLSGASFQIADARNLPLPDGLFDYASISFALHEKERQVRDRVISEMKRVVKKGGALIFIDFSVPLPKKPISCFVRVAEFMAGREHHRCFRDYLAQGGLEAILKKSQLQEEKRAYLKSGLITMIKTANGVSSSTHPAQACGG